MGYLLVNMCSFCLTCLRRFNKAAFMQVLNMSSICVWYNLPVQDLYTLADAPGSPLKATIGHACSHPSFQMCSISLQLGYRWQTPLQAVLFDGTVDSVPKAATRKCTRGVGNSGADVLPISHPRATRQGRWLEHPLPRSAVRDPTDGNRSITLVSKSPKLSPYFDIYIYMCVCMCMFVYVYIYICIYSCDDIYIYIHIVVNIYL